MDEPVETVAEHRRGIWKRRRRTLWKRIFRKTTLVVLVAVAIAFALFYYFSRNIGTYKDPD